MPLIIPFLSNEQQTQTDKWSHHEYAECIIFQELVNFPIVFKGGTALRLVHGSSRFSEDLDFDLAEPLDDKGRTELAIAIRDHLVQLGRRVNKVRGKGRYNRHFRVYYQYTDSPDFSKKPVLSHGTPLLPSVKIEIAEFRTKDHRTRTTFQSNAHKLVPEVNVEVYDIDFLMTGKINALFTRQEKGIGAMRGKRKVEGRDLFDFVEFGKGRNISWEYLDDFDKNHAQDEILYRKLAEVLKLIQEGDKLIMRDIQRMYPQNKRSFQDYFSLVVENLQSLNLPADSGFHDEIRILFQRFQH